MGDVVGMDGKKLEQETSFKVVFKGYDACSRRVFEVMYPYVVKAAEENGFEITCWSAGEIEE